MPSAPKHRFQELDSLRGIAAIMVVLLHFTSGTPYARQFGFYLGVTGVDLFFMISGFVIFMSLGKIKKGSDFVINRVSRLYPTYWACVTCTFLATILVVFIRHDGFNSIPFLTYLANLTMFQFYLGFYNLDNPYWTLVVEMWFYLFILILFQAGLIRKINTISVVLILISITLTRFFFSNTSVTNLLTNVPLLQFMPLFLAGIVFYKIYTEPVQLTGKYSLIVFCLVSQFLLFPYVGVSHQFLSLFEYSSMIVAYFLIFTLFANHRMRWIVNKPTLFLGKISYTLYLIHSYIGSHIIMLILYGHLHLNFELSLSITIGAVILLAAFITYYIEAPLTKKMKNKLHSLFDSKKQRDYSLTK